MWKFSHFLAAKAQTNNDKQRRAQTSKGKLRQVKTSKDELGQEKTCQEKLSKIEQLLQAQAFQAVFFNPSLKKNYIISSTYLLYSRK